MSKNLYIVPHDLTHVGDVALQYGLHLGKFVNAEIRLLHLVNSKAEAIAANKKIDEIISKADNPNNVVISRIVKEGSIFEDIGKIAMSEKAQLIIMGTHGEKGMQKLFGSYAMKVITSCDVPFLVVQDNTNIKPIERLVVPIDLTKESLQVVNLAGDIANIFNATVHVVGEKQRDTLLNQQMKNRILIVKNQYEERNVECSVEFMKDGGSYSKKIMEYAKAQSIDLIAISYHSESLIPQFDKFAQNLITNETNLPCLVINSKPASALYF